MKNLRRGFSLAELLITIGIISVIATIGFTMSKRSIDRAYDAYIYTGYKGLMDAISIANANNTYLDYAGGPTQEKFFKNLVNALNSTNPSYAENSVKFTAQNNIEYDISRYNCSKPENAPVSEYKCTYYVKMSVPTRKRSVDSSGSKLPICLAYLPQDDYGILIPFEKDESYCEGELDLSKRMDLLPFYIDDGFVGRRIDPNLNYTAKEYYSAKDAICNIHTGDVIVATKTLFTCPAGPKVKGSIRVANPMKLKAF